MKSDNISLLLSVNEIIATTDRPQDLLKPVFDKIYKLYNSPVGGICFLENNKSYAYIFLGDESFKESQEDILNSSERLLYRFRIEELPFYLNRFTKKIFGLKLTEILESFGNNPRFNQFRHLIEKHKIKQSIQVPLWCSGEIIGFLIFGINGNNPLEDEEKLEFIQQFANLLASGLKNKIILEELRKRELYQSVMLRITNTLISIKDRDSMFDHLANEFYKSELSNSFLNYTETRLTNFFTGDPVIVRFRMNEKFKYVPYGYNHDLFSILESLGIKPEGEKNQLVIEHNELDNLCRKHSRLDLICRNSNIHELYWQLYITNDGNRIDNLIGSVSPLVSPELELQFATNMIAQIAIILKNYAAYEEINSLKKQLEQEKVSLLDEISRPDDSQKIIGSSQIIQSVLYKIRQVALIDATVLILGETGTGKELIAHAIHNTSLRKDKVMVKVNCAALPAQLIESELFGHEKGSFTGAIENRIGKFELANGGTIFLDEIGEMPMELQAKLLRILQEKEFERIGGKQTIKADVRIIAATNRNLEEEVNAGRFRADLYYRLNVFPITVPPLRNRKEDIPLFVQHFAEKYAKSMGKKVKEISQADLDAFMNYDWPGNIRELEHLIERATIISSGHDLDFSDVKIFKTIRKPEDLSSFKPLVEMEREYIISALRAANGKIMGANSAASLLGLNGKTLASKMRKLGIKREIVIN